MCCQLDKSEIGPRRIEHPCARLHLRVQYGHIESRWSTRGGLGTSSAVSMQTSSWRRGPTLLSAGTRKSMGEQMLISKAMPCHSSVDLRKRDFGHVATSCKESITYQGDCRGRVVVSDHDTSTASASWESALARTRSEAVYLHPQPSTSQLDSSRPPPQTFPRRPHHLFSRAHLHAAAVAKH